MDLWQGRERARVGADEHVLELENRETFRSYLQNRTIETRKKFVSRESGRTRGSCSARSTRRTGRAPGSTCGTGSWGRGSERRLPLSLSLSFPPFLDIDHHGSGGFRVCHQAHRGFLRSGAHLVGRHVRLPGLPRAEPVDLAEVLLDGGVALEAQHAASLRRYSPSIFTSNLVEVAS